MELTYVWDTTAMQGREQGWLHEPDAGDKRLTQVWTTTSMHQGGGGGGGGDVRLNKGWLQESDAGDTGIPRSVPWQPCMGRVVQGIKLGLNHNNHAGGLKFGVLKEPPYIKMC